MASPNPEWGAAAFDGAPVWKEISDYAYVQPDWADDLIAVAKRRVVWVGDLTAPGDQSILRSEEMAAAEQARRERWRARNAWVFEPWARELRGKIRG